MNEKTIVDTKSEYERARCEVFFLLIKKELRISTRREIGEDIERLEGSLNKVSVNEMKSLNELVERGGKVM